MWRLHPYCKRQAVALLRRAVGHKKIQVRVEVFHLLIQERNHRQQPFLPVRNLGQAARPQVQKKHQKQANQRK